MRSEPALFKRAYEERGLRVEPARYIPQPFNRTTGGEVRDPTELLIERFRRGRQQLAAELREMMGDGVAVTLYQVVDQVEDALGGSAKIIIPPILVGVQ